MPRPARYKRRRTREGMSLCALRPPRAIQTQPDSRTCFCPPYSGAKRVKDVLQTLSMPLELNMLIEGEQRRVWSLTDPSNPATVREHTKKLAIIRRTAPRAPINSKQGHDYKAYLIGQQRLQSMPHSLAKSRTKSVQNQLPF